MEQSRKHASIRKELTKIWRKNNPEQHKANIKNYFAKKHGAEGTFNGTDIQQLYLDQGGLCRCGTTLFRYHIDHKTPLSRGGSNWPFNIQLLCGTCNMSKGAKTSEEWLYAPAS